MKKKIVYTDEDIGNPRRIKDFLPPPEELIFKEEEVKVTLTLSKRSVDFFKSQAAEHDTQYQPMIRKLLDAYARVHEHSATYEVKKKSK